MLCFIYRDANILRMLFHLVLQCQWGVVLQHTYYTTEAPLRDKSTENVSETHISSSEVVKCRIHITVSKFEKSLTI